VYELCHFAKTIRDEDECSLDDALVKAFGKVKDQRDLINQNQLSGSSYRPGRREVGMAVAKGWRPEKHMANAGVTDAVILDGVKEMGTCKQCKKPAIVNDDGYCKECAAKMEEEANEGEDKPKGGSPLQKSGRVLSQRNYNALQDVVEDLGECAAMDIPRTAKALVRGCMVKIKTVLDAATPEDPVNADTESKDPPAPEPKTLDHVLGQAIEAAMSDRSIRDRLRKALNAIDGGEELEQLADEFRVLTSTG
jgi:hypothetical protein